VSSHAWTRLPRTLVQLHKLASTFETHLNFKCPIPTRWIETSETQRGVNGSATPVNAEIGRT
jgi:hypothetical protein